VHPLRAGDVGVDLLGQGVAQLARDDGVDARRQRGENDGGD